MNHILHIQKVIGVAGSENHLLDLLPRLDSTKFSVSFLILKLPNINIDHYLLLLKQKSVLTKVVKIRNHFDPICFLEILRYLKSENISLVHTHLIHADIYGLIASKIAGIRNRVSTRHNDNPFRYKKGIASVLKMLYKLTQKTITVSDYLADFCVSIEGVSPKEVVTIHHGVNFDTQKLSKNKNPVTDLRKKYAISSNSFLLLCVGRIIEQKGHIFAIRALEKLKDMGEDVHLIIVGEGNKEGQLKKFAEEIDVSRNVTFAGWQNHVEQFMNASDLFLHPSLWEGFGIVLIEAMKAKRAIVATNVGAIPEVVVSQETGLLVPPKDAKSLALSISLLMHTPEMLAEMEINSFNRAKKWFSIGTMVKKTENVYIGMLGN